MRYEIHEANMDRLRKHMTKIGNKCAKYGCEFKFSEIGETFREEKKKGGETYYVRYIVVDVEGTAILNDWEFIAELEHTANGNIIRKCKSDIEVPERYYNTKAICEHCNSHRYRKNTYVVHNVKTGEFKQLGKSCLKDYTHGLSAEGIASFLAGFDKLATFEQPPTGGGYERYVDRDMFLRYVAETVRLCGYVKRRVDIYDDIDPNNTLDRAMRIMQYKERGILPFMWTEKDMREYIPVGFDANSEKAKEIAKSAYEYVNGLEGNNNYIHNLKTVIANRYVSYRDTGLLASAIPYYNRYVEKCEEENRRKREARKEAEKSAYVGKVGERVKNLKIVGAKCIYSCDTLYGVSYMYKMVDENYNVLIWFTSKDLPEEEFMLTGTIKELKEYNGVKETVVTRCRITEC